MKMGWESDDERLRRWVKIPAKQKLEWLEAMHRFAVKISSKRLMAIRWKLRENHIRDGKFKNGR